MVKNIDETPSQAFFPEMFMSLVWEIYRSTLSNIPCTTPPTKIKEISNKRKGKSNY